MTPLALALVLTAAVLHATWNLLAKRAGGGTQFIFLYFILSSVIYAPVAITVWFLWPQSFTPIDVVFIVGNGALHLIYFFTLQRGYQLGDLSLVYPLARGTGPLLASVTAIFFLGEHPSRIAIAGIVAIVAGVFLASAVHRMSEARARASMLYGIGTGVTIAVYTLWDKHAMTALALSPILYDWGGNLARTLMAAPLAMRKRTAILTAWRDHRFEAIGIAVLSPLAYLLVLWALTWTPVSYVAPARELSILFGTLYGITLFNERERMQQRFAASALMLAGIVALAHG